jgi:hypothetical protein
MALAWGKLISNVSVANGDKSMPAAISTPLARAPALLPPAPQNMSSVLIIDPRAV